MSKISNLRSNDITSQHGNSVNPDNGMMEIELEVELNKDTNYNRTRTDTLFNPRRKSTDNSNNGYVTSSKTKGPSIFIPWRVKS